MLINKVVDTALAAVEESFAGVDSATASDTSTG